jgi:3-deoxy-D-manno-octulosonic-acid transferase
MAQRLPVLPQGGVWIHGSSVGEARIVAALARCLRARDGTLPLAASAFTRTGRAQLPSPPAVDAAFFLPLDFAGLPGRVLSAVRPRLLAIVETELWPNLVHEARRFDVAVALVNGRLSPERMARYRRLSGLYGPLVTGLARVGAQSDDDAARFSELGVADAALEITGNLKFDLPAPEVHEERLRAELGLAAGRAIFVAGSTGQGEDPLVLDAFLAARAEHADLFLVLAPRHPERCDAVQREVGDRGLRVERHSALTGPLDRETDVLLVDTLGQLGRLYKLGAVAFVGGSLVPVGGHNVLEPAAVGTPVVFGPYTEHFAEPAQALEQAGGGLRVRDGAALAGTVVDLVRDAGLRRRTAESAAQVVARNRGALERSIEMIFSVLQRRQAQHEEPS